VSAVFPFLRSAVRRAAIAGRTRHAVLALAATLLLLLVFAAALRMGREGRGEFTVRRGTLAPSVPLVGTLSPARSDSYGAVVPGVELKILSLVEEGSLVALGDRLIQFDPAPFQKEREVAHARARELATEEREARLALLGLRLKSNSDVYEATTSAQASERDLSALVNTGAPLSARESAHDVEQKERSLKEAQDKLAGLEPFVEKGFISQEEYRTARSRRDQAAADLELARARHAALVRQANPDLIRKKLDETEKDKAQLELLRERTRVSLAQGEAAVGLTAIRLEEANRQVAEAEKKIAWCTVTAKAPGLAVYSDVFDRTGERRKIRVGDSVWGGTTVVTLPDLTRMMIHSRVPESEIHHLAPGQTVNVTLDAFPEEKLSGLLRSIGSVGASEKNESRSFPLTISLDQADSRFRPGMVARCSVRGNRIENALYIPVEAAHSDDRGAFVWVDSLLGRPAVRRVVLGRHTPQFVEVREGLRERERVRIADPE
jgi:multidrug resistance efflux pump